MYHYSSQCQLRFTTPQLQVPQVFWFKCIPTQCLKIAYISIELKWNRIKKQENNGCFESILINKLSFFSNLYINCSLILHHLNFWKTDRELNYVKINHNITLTLIYNNRAVWKSWVVVHDNKLHYFSFLWKYMLFFFLWIGILWQCVCSILHKERQLKIFDFIRVC